MLTPRRRLPVLPLTDILQCYFGDACSTPASVAGTPSYTNVILASVPLQKVSPEIMEEFRDHAPAQVSFGIGITFPH